MFGLSNPFKRQAKPSEPPSENEMLREILQRLKDLESDSAGLRMEWAEVLDKVKSWAGRQAQRDRREAMRALESPQNDESGEPHPDIAPESHSAHKEALRRRVFGKR